VSRGVTRRPLLGLLIPAAVAVLFIALPLIGLLAHVDWSNLGTELVSANVLTALRLSLEFAQNGDRILTAKVPPSWEGRWPPR